MKTFNSIVLPCLAGALLTTPVGARVFVITDTNDSIAITSLRGAVIAANHLGGNNTIVLSRPINRRNNQARKWVYGLTIQGGGESAALTGDLNITRGNLTIIGSDPDTTIDASRLGDRVFQVSANARLSLYNLKIEGGSAPTEESGGAIFNAGSLVIEHCSIAGNAAGPSPQGLAETLGNGGGIFNEGIMILDNSEMSNNVAGNNAHGGAIYNRGKATIDECIVVSNSAGPDNGCGFGGGNGGGICNLQFMTLNNCVISGNTGGQGGPCYPSGWVAVGTAAFGSAAGNGGGIWNSGNLQLTRCTVSGNTSGRGGDGGQGIMGGSAGAGGDGGALFNVGVLSMNTCTISGNLCGGGGNGGYGWQDAGGNGADGGNGAGVYNDGSLTVTSCTIALNQTGVGGNGGNSQDAKAASIGGQGGDGGGILNEMVASHAVVRNTLVALNSPNAGGLGGTNSTGSGEAVGTAGSNGFGFDLVGAFVSRGFNLIGTTDGSIGFTNGITADQTGTDSKPIDPVLGPLQMNGGFTPTHALVWGGPAIDKGNCFGIRVDQRGHRRPHNFTSLPNATGGDGSDIGAFELDTF